MSLLLIEVACNSTVQLNTVRQVKGFIENCWDSFTSAQILPTIEIVSIGYNPRKVSAPRRIASVPTSIKKQIRKKIKVPEFASRYLIKKFKKKDLSNFK